MAQRTTLDITNIPELRRLGNEVHETGEPIVLQADGEDVAIVQPLGKRRSHLDFKPTEEQIQITMSAAGGWQGLIDSDELKAQIKTARGSKRPVIEL